MQAFKTSRALVLDVEATCWEGGIPPAGMRSEIIEIGIVEIDLDAFAVSREASYLVRPSASEISAYCSELTGITPERMKAGGRPFKEVLRTLAGHFGPARKCLLAWGDDWSDIESACRDLGEENPFPRDGFVNLGLMATLLAGAGRRLGLYEAMDALGVEATGRRHSGLDDARNAGKFFLSVAEQSRPLLSRPAAAPSR